MSKEDELPRTSLRDRSFGPLLAACVLIAGAVAWNLGAPRYLRELWIANPTQVVEDLRVKVMASPGDASGYIALAKALRYAAAGAEDPDTRAQLESEQRIAVLQSALVAEPENLPLLDAASAEELAEACDRLGLGFLGVQRADDAIRFFARAREVNPSNPRYPNLEGTLFYMQGKFEPAAERFKAALAVDPAFAPALLNLGLLDFELKNSDGKDALVRAMREHPDREDLRKTYEQLFGPVQP